MKGSKIVLIARGVWYYSKNDEAAFFEWLDKMTCVEGYGGEGDILNIEVVKKKVNNESLGDLLAFFYRYKIDMKQLAVFENSRNRAWFTDPQKYWAKRVFGKNKTDETRAVGKLMKGKHEVTKS